MTDTSAEDVGFYQKPLYTLLDATFQDRLFRTKQGLFDVVAYAKAIKMSPEGVYKWIRSDRMSAEGARRTIELSVNRLSKEQLATFVIG